MYKIFWKKSALKDIRKVPQDLRIKILEAIDGLEIDPRPLNSKKMQNFNYHYRIRINDYRVIYSIEGKRLIIEIIRIAHRKDIYKKL